MEIDDVCLIDHFDSEYLWQMQEGIKKSNWIEYGNFCIMYNLRSVILRCICLKHHEYMLYSEIQ